MNKDVGLRSGMVRLFSKYGLSVLLLTAVLMVGCEKSNDSLVLPAPEVGVLKVAVEAVPLDLNYTAHTRGIRDVEVRARVSGILLKRHYREGSYVKAGHLLFEIDPAPFAAEVERAKGQLAVARAQSDEAGKLRNRLEALHTKQAVAEHDYDVAQTRYEAAKAAVAAAQAGLRSAELDLGYTRVTAPISGFTSSEVRSEGSLVQAGTESSLLTTITQDDRLYVDFSIPEDEASRVRTALALHPDAVRVRLVVGGGAEIPETARIEFIDLRISTDTSTVNVRAVLDNKANKATKNSGPNLSPGQYVRVRIEGILSAPAIHVPSRAVMFGADGPFVWILDEKNIVKLRSVRIGSTRGNLMEIQEGLAAGDRVVIDGILKVQPDAEVKPVDTAPESEPNEAKGADA